MVSFRRRKKNLQMQDKRASGEARANEEPENGEIKVTDRRRINVDGEPISQEGRDIEEPRLKPAYVEELETRAKTAENKLLEVQSRFEQLKAQLQRETDETRQRLNKAADERARREKVVLLSSLLPVAENLKRAIEAAEGGGSLDVLLDGVRGTASGFDNALAAAGVETVPAVGAPFDPELHEAVDITEVDPDRDGIVSAEYSPGYRIGDRLIKPARVQVGRAGEGARHQGAE